MKEFNSNNYVIEVQGSMRHVSAQDWDALLDAQTEPTPFMRHAYLSAMEESGSASAKTGWQLQLVTLRPVPYTHLTLPTHFRLIASMVWLV